MSSRTRIKTRKQMLSFNFGFDSGSRAHFRSENLMTDSERKWALEAESKPEIEGKHLHHKDMFKYVI